MREIVLDTETTGLDPRSGHRVVEIGCVELVNHIRTGRHWHQYINPERSMPAEAYNIHGLSTEFLSEKPVFATVADSFLDFIGDGRLVIHNAPFDVGFLNAELEAVGRPPLAFDRVVDTLVLARRRFPGGSNSLDDLCRRFGIDNSRREVHGALLDAELLSDVYVEMTVGRQAALSLVEASQGEDAAKPVLVSRSAPLPPRITDGELAAHRAFVATLGESALWNRYLDDMSEEN
jgi:DNA polymerase III subunit epsilon